MAGLKRSVTVANLAASGGETLYHSPQVPRFKSVEIRNASTIAVPVYLDASGPIGTPDFVIGPREYATVGCDCTQIFFGYFAMPEPPAGMVYMFASDEARAAASGTLPLVITESGGAPIATGSGSRLALLRVNWLLANVAQSRAVITPNFTPRSVRLYGIAGGAFLFSDPAVAVPVAFDANGVPSDPSYCGQVAQGGDVTLHLPEGVPQVVLTPLGSAADLYRRNLGANHLWKLDDAVATTARDTIGTQIGNVRPTLVLARQPAIYPGSAYSMLGQGSAGGSDNVPAMVDTLLPEPNNGNDFSVEFEYKPASIANLQTQNVILSHNAAATNGWRFRQTGNGAIVLNLLGAISINPAFVLAAGTIYHIVIVFGVAAKVYTIYINGVNIGTASGTAYVPSTGTLQVCGDNFAGSKLNAPGNYANVTTYPFTLTAQQVTGLYAQAQNPVPPEIMTAITDDLWPPYAGKIA